MYLDCSQKYMPTLRLVLASKKKRDVNMNMFTAKIPCMYTNRKWTKNLEQNSRFQLLLRGNIPLVWRSFLPPSPPSSTPQYQLMNKNTYTSGQWTFFYKDWVWLKQKICIQDGKRCLKILWIKTRKNNNITHAKKEREKEREWITGTRESLAKRSAF